MELVSDLGNALSLSENWVHLMEDSALNRAENSLGTKAWARCTKGNRCSFLFASLFRCSVVKVSRSILILMKFHIQVTTTYQLSKELLCIGSWDRLLNLYMAMLKDLIIHQRRQTYQQLSILSTRAQLNKC